MIGEKHELYVYIYIHTYVYVGWSPSLMRAYGNNGRRPRQKLVLTYYGNICVYTQLCMHSPIPTCIPELVIILFCNVQAVFGFGIRIFRTFFVTVRAGTEYRHLFPK